MSSAYDSVLPLTPICPLVTPTVYALNSTGDRGDPCVSPDQWHAAQPGQCRAGNLGSQGLQAKLFPAAILCILVSHGDVLSRRNTADSCAIKVARLHQSSALSFDLYVRGCDLLSTTKPSVGGFNVRLHVHIMLNGQFELAGCEWKRVSSAIIHLFQRKPLKDNELGVLQEHVRFLISSEAGGLVHEYYKDQLLRKGMIILREKIKNEQGLELLKQLGETWEYFFKEILPTLQAILYPLMDLLGEDETIRSLSLLAFRNIVVLKVSIKEALDSVEKHTYPTSIQQMLLVLQSIQDNVFLSENQFLLEKLVARVVCPYLGQRGIYEGSPDPVIKVKLKPIPIIIPTGVVSDNRFSAAKCRQKLEHQAFPSPVSPWKGGPHDISSMKKLKPVLEHVYEVGRRHSIIS